MPPVLNQLLVGLSEEEKTETLELFRAILDTIMILSDLLSSSALARLLHIPQDDVDVGLDMLHSVLNIPPSRDIPIKLFHLSFRDFLLDPSKRSTNIFWIDEKEAHKRVATNCLQIMEEFRQEDICQVQAPGTLLSSVEPSKISEHLPPEIHYAFRFWVFHLEHAGGQISDEDQVWRFLTTHFLHWLEGLCWMEKILESLQAIKALQSAIRVSLSQQLPLTMSYIFSLSIAHGFLLF
jgi:hypothetical protein